jgi:hypothetical protein
MNASPNKMTGNFNSKPQTQQFFSVIDAFVQSLGQSKQTIKSQISYGVNRKFLWLWAYDQTPDGTLYLTVCLDRPLSDSLFHYVTQVSPHRYNHHIEVKSQEIAESPALRDLIRAGYEFAQQ